MNISLCGNTQHLRPGRPSSRYWLIGFNRASAIQPLTDMGEMGNDSMASTFWRGIAGVYLLADLQRYGLFKLNTMTISH